jgi:hypothetical protein
LSPLFVVLAMALAFAPVVFVIYRIARPSPSPLDDLARALNGTKSGKVVTFGREGREYRCDASVGGRRSRPWVELRTDSAPAVTYVAVRASVFARLWARIGGGDPVTLADPVHERTMALFSRDAIAAGAFFAVPDRRAALAELGTLDATEVGQDEAEIVVRWLGRSAYVAGAAERVPAALDAVARLAGGTPSPGARDAVRRRIAVQGGAMLGLFAIFFGAIFLSAFTRERFQVLDWFPLLLATLWCSVPLAVASGMMVARSDSTRTVSLRRSTRGMLWALLALPYFVLQLAIVANGFFDDGQQAVHDARVMRVHVVEGRDSRYEVIVGSWRDRSEETVEVSRDTVRRVRPGGAMRVVTKPGWLGYEWIAAYSPIDGSR